MTADVGAERAGAFNLQIGARSSPPEESLIRGRSQSNSLQNAAIVQEAVNDVVSNIVVDEVIANVGVNAVSGVGNAQLNSFTARHRSDFARAGARHACERALR
jgi:hypothetical protein